MRGERGRSNPNQAAAASLKFKAYRIPITKTGETMTTQTISNPRYPICERAQRIQDVLMVSSFGLWATILGLSPVLAYRLLVG